MKQLAVLLVFITQCSFAQSTAIVEIIHKIEFKEDTIRYIYEWVADNISYDVAKLNDLKNRGSTKDRSRFKNEAEYNVHLLQQVIKKKKGVCQDYSLLFDALLKELGYESYIIGGYTKNRKGRIIGSIGHTWNAVKVNHSWKLYDPTWGAGYVNDESKFVKTFNEDWYEVSPEDMIVRHMPFDPIWQLLEHPVSYRNFKNNSVEGEREIKLNFNELIQEFLKRRRRLKCEIRCNAQRKWVRG